MSNIKLLFGSNIRQIRKVKGISQEQLADLASLHRTYIGSVERGERNISLENIVTLANALEVSPCELLKGIR
jgi:transcriptional regulator with XRE-family HTH domain